MRARQKYLAIISRIVPVGAVGASVLLGSTIASAAVDHPTQIRPPAAAALPGVSERLAAIREAVFVVAGPEGAATHGDPEFHLVWGNRWNNWGSRRRPGRGWGRPAWNNWRNFQPRWNNWNNAWRNW
jgi:hypothetical protein